MIQLGGRLAVGGIMETESLECGGRFYAGDLIGKCRVAGEDMDISGGLSYGGKSWYAIRLLPGY